MVAKEDGDVQWLDEIPNPDQLDYGYYTFYDSIDTTIMGNTTYQQVLGFDVPFPYKGKTNYVLTRNAALEDDENVQFISKNVIERIREMKQGEGKDIWLVGGGGVNTLLRNNGLVDELILFVMPIILGAGIPLFAERVDESKLKLIESKNYPTGVVELRYKIEQ